jgi:hypothetical protein
MLDQPKSRFERFLRSILASRFLTISALIHLLIIVLFGGRALFNRYVEPPDFQYTGDATLATDTPQAPPTAEVALPQTPSLAAPPPSASTPAATLAALTSLSSNASSFTMPLPPVQPPEIGKEFSTQPTQTFGNGIVSLPGPMAGRPGGGRGGTGGRFGERPSAEAAVLRALRWLQAQQQSDGTWGSEKYKGAFTGLAVLCFLGHGETPATSHEFGVVVNNGINSLVTEASRSDGRLCFSPDFNDNSAVYQHAIGTYALCEAYTMTKDQRIAPLVKQAVDYIVKGQRPDGGWHYQYDTGPDPDARGETKSDTSVSGWQIQALKAAHLTAIPGIEDAVHPVLDLAMRNMDRVYDSQDGTFGYRKAGDIHGRKGEVSHDLTGVGVLSKLFWLGRADRTVTAGLKDITSTDLNYRGPNCNLYAWYYNTQACFQAQGGAWGWWNQRFQNQLIPTQNADGSWPPVNSKEPGGLARDPGGDGPLYRTTLCCLMLEVFYRYLPTTQTDALGGGQVEGL